LDPARPSLKVVVDTNVIAYFLLGTEAARDECHEFWRHVDHPLAPASWEAELTNVLWMAVRKKVIDLPEGLRRLDLAGSLGIESVPVASLWHGALARAHASGIAAYDTVFVELAERESLPLATFDGPLTKAFPRIAQRPRACVRSPR
jgi:predicted nucleic acid-binding protein